jgi:hypothetical protein
MLTDTALRNLKPKAQPYKAAGRDGMYVTVSPIDNLTLRLLAQWTLVNDNRRLIEITPDDLRVL